MHAAAGSDVRVNLCMRVGADARQRRVRNRAATGSVGVRMLGVREVGNSRRRQRLVRQRLRIRRADDRASHTMHAAAGSDVRVNLCMRVRADARQRRVRNRAATGCIGMCVLGVGEVADTGRRQRFVRQRLRRRQQHILLRLERVDSTPRLIDNRQQSLDNVSAHH